MMTATPGVPPCLCMRVRVSLHVCDVRACSEEGLAGPAEALSRPLSPWSAHLTLCSRPVIGQEWVFPWVSQGNKNGRLREIVSLCTRPGVLPHSVRPRHREPHRWRAGWSAPARAPSQAPGGPWLPGGSTRGWDGHPPLSTGSPSEISASVTPCGLPLCVCLSGSKSLLRTPVTAFRGPLTHAHLT